MISVLGCVCVAHTRAHTWPFWKGAGEVRVKHVSGSAALHLWQLFCPQPQGGGTTQLWTRWFLSRTSSPCPLWLPLASLKVTAGCVLSMDCSGGERGSDEGRLQKHSRTNSKINYTYFLHPCKWAFPSELKAWAGGAHEVLGPSLWSMPHKWKLFAERPFCLKPIKDSRSFMQSRRTS